MALEESIGGKQGTAVERDYSDANFAEVPKDSEVAVLGASGKGKGNRRSEPRCRGKNSTQLTRGRRLVVPH